MIVSGFAPAYSRYHTHNKSNKGKTIGKTTISVMR